MLSAYTKREIVRLYTLTNMTQTQIAKEVGHSRFVVSTTLQERGIKIVKKKKFPKFDPVIKDKQKKPVSSYRRHTIEYLYWHTEMTIKTIAQELNMSSRSVSKILKQKAFYIDRGRGKRGKPNKLPTRYYPIIKQMLLDGIPNQSIAQEFGIHQQHIRYISKQYLGNITRNSGRFSSLHVRSQKIVDNIDQIIVMHTYDKLSCGQIAKLTGIGAGAIANVLKVLNLYHQQTCSVLSVLTKKQKQQIVTMYLRDKMSCQKLGQMFDVTAMTIHRALKKEGVVMRQVGSHDKRGKLRGKYNKTKSSSLSH